MAWVVIIGTALASIVLPRLLTGPEQSRRQQDAVGLMLMRLQSQYVVGIKDLGLLDGAAAYAQVSGTLNAGTVGQRQRFVVLVAELAGPAEAGEALQSLDELIVEETARGGDPPFELTEEQASVHEILHSLYPPLDEDAADGLPERVAALSAAQRTTLEDQLGWFGRLALLPEGTDRPAERSDVLGPARRTAASLVGAVILLLVGGFGGFVGLLLLLVFALSGRVRSRLVPATGHHGIYAETFAIWIAGFFGLQIVAGMAASALPGSDLALGSVAFLVSLAALAWPTFRGIPWSAVRRDIGWTAGPAGIGEPLVGVGGYFMALPLLAVGMVVTLVLVFIQSLASGPVAPFDPVGGPAHPVVIQLGGADLWPKLQVLFLGAVVAPIVEETMFRGVLYRHLRDATGRLGLATSVLLAATINAFVFAVIHPQGWVAIPALMGLAYAFVMMREWRGSVVPAMVVHGVSNGLVLGMLMLMLGP